MFGRSFGVLVVSVVLNLSVISLGATYGGGSGTRVNPYQIWTPEQLNTIGANPDDWRKRFILMADIDMSAYTGTQYKIIGDSRIKFTGTFDGNDHIIRNLTYKTSSNGYVGLFGCAENAVIKNLGLENISISSYYGGSVGGLAGINYSGTIISCYATGSINSKCSSEGIGGLVGDNINGKLTDCFSSCSVEDVYGTDIGGLVGLNTGVLVYCRATGSVKGWDEVGGLVGNNRGPIFNCYAAGSSGPGDIGGFAGFNEYCPLSNCYATGAVTGTDTRACVGGLVGDNYYGSIAGCFARGTVSGVGHSLGGLVANNCGTITACYAIGNVSGTNEYAIGGLIGHNSGYASGVTACYAAGAVSTTGSGFIGGLIGGQDAGSASSCFWDVESTGQTAGTGTGSSAGIIGKTTALMQARSTFESAGWDFADTWAICDGMNYPRLLNMIPFADMVCPDGVGAEDLDHFASQWLTPECGIVNDFCQGADINQSSVVNLRDFVFITEQWLLSESILPPSSFLPSPVALWKMDEATGMVVADSVGGHDGQVVNAAGTLWVAGQSNNALKLDGVDDYVDVAGYAGVMGTASRTCTAWIKATASGNVPTILSWGNEANGQKWIVRVQGGGKLAVAVWGGYIQGSTLVVDGQWHHVAAVLVDDGSPSVNEIKLYVDGVAQTVTYDTTQAIDTGAGQNVQMGSVYSGTAQTRFFIGLLDEVRIYDVPLTGEQILRVAME
ncbi:MAG TPA: GLUG motif-containing protein [Anaerohalosphaeraceae bacterium]|nr:GLUG motif-containing protein [Anaerohalosphaeraceae bacterium]